MHLTQLVTYAGVEQDAFGCRCLACINVRTDTNVAIALNGSFTSHGNYLTLSFKEQLNGRA